MWAMKQRFLTWQTRRAANKKTVRNTVGYDKARTIGLLFHYQGPESAGQVRIFADRLREEGRQVTILGFVEKPLENAPQGMDLYSRADYSLTGKNNSEAAKAFTTTSFDFLFFFGDLPRLELEQVLAECKAQCRVGGYQEHATPYFEMMVQGPAPNQWEQLFRQFTAFTQKLRSAS